MVFYFCEIPLFFFYTLRFINLCEYLELKKIPPRIGEGNMEREMKHALLDIQKAEREALVKNLPIILDKLIELLVTAYRIGGQLLLLGPTVFEVLCSVSANLQVIIKSRIIFVFFYFLLLKIYEKLTDSF